MEIIRFKTNVKNIKAYLKGAPYLNKAVGPVNWQLDLDNTDKVLTVFSPDYVKEDAVAAVISKAGYRATNLDDYYAVY